MITATVLAAFCAALPANAETIAIAPGLPGWEELKFDDLTPNTWREENGALVVESNNSVSIMYFRPLSVDLSQTPVLTWEWRVDSGPPATDLSRKGGDDRSIAIAVGYAYDSANASMGERMKRVVVEAAAGADAPGRLLDMAWGGSAAPETILRSPYTGSAGRILTKQNANAPTGEWVTESVDLAARYQQEWGNTAPNVISVSVSADTDDTRAVGNARIRNIRFVAR